MKNTFFAFIFLIFLIFQFNLFAQQPDTIEAYKSRTKEGLIFGFNQKLPINGQYGILVGLLEECRISKKLFLRPQIILTLLPYKVSNKKEISRLLEIPFTFLFKPFDFKNNPTISIGPNFKFDIENMTGGFFGDISFGVERNLKHYTIEPELRLSYGQKMQILYLAVIFKQ